MFGPKVEDISERSSLPSADMMAAIEILLIMIPNEGATTSSWENLAISGCAPLRKVSIQPEKCKAKTSPI